jgi:hypothetical protein
MLYNPHLLVNLSEPVTKSQKPIVLVPIIRPKRNEFHEFDKLMSQIQQKSSHFGVCKVIPHSSWKPASILPTLNNVKFTQYRHHSVILIFLIDVLQSFQAEYWLFQQILHWSYTVSKRCANLSFSLQQANKATKN